MSRTLTWLGHATFRVDTPGGKRIYVDPFLNGNPKCPESEVEPERVDAIFITHGHGDHYGDTVELAGKFGCTVVAPVELADWLQGQGVESVRDPNKGGTVEVEGVKVTLTHAQHSSSTNDGTYAGEPCGLVVELEDGFKLYFAGDTNVFGDMALIARIYEPDLAVLPIGDHYTMGPREAAVALELLGVKRCVPCHYGTFPVLTGTPEQLRELAPDVEVIAPEPGGRSSCERALVRGDRSPGPGARARRVARRRGGARARRRLRSTRRSRHAHLTGQPVVVRASTPEAVKAALARPEVAWCSSRREELLALDLTSLTYG